MRAGLPDEPARLAASTPLAAAIVLSAGAAVAGAAFALGLWCGRHGRRIAAERQLDMITEKAQQVHDLMAAAAAPSPEHNSKDPCSLRVLGRDGNDATPGNADARSSDETSGQHPGPRRES